MRPICVKCEVEMEISEIGVHVTYVDDAGPREVWLADVASCPVCFAKVMTGFGRCPVYRRCEDGFDRYITKIQSGSCMQVACYLTRSKKV